MTFILEGPWRVRASDTWDGGGTNDNWSTLQNWDTDSLPSFVFGLTFGPALRLSPSNDIDALTVGGLTFSAGAGAYTLLGKPVTLAGNIDCSATASNAHTVLMDLTLPADIAATTGPDGADLTLGGHVGESVPGVGLTKWGAGTLYLAASNSFSGGILVTGGMAVAAHDLALGTAAGGVVVATNATMGLQGGVRVAGESISIAGSGAPFVSPLITNALGAMRNIVGTNEWAGTITVSGAADTRIICQSGKIVISGNIINLSTGGNLVLQGDGDGEISGIISGTRPVFKSNAWATNVGTWTISATNTFTGSMTFAGGVLQLSSEWNLGVVPATYQAAHFRIRGGTVRNLQTMSISPTRGVTIANEGGAFEPVAGTTFTVNSMVVGTASTSLFVKAGAGTLVLASTNTYRGRTIVSNGTLRIDGNSAAATNTVTVLPGATLGGVGSIGGAVTVQGSGRLAPGASPGTTTVARLTLEAGAVYEAEVSGAAADMVVSAGAVSLDGAVLSAVRLSDATLASMVIVSNLAGGIAGQFAGLPEFAPVLTNSGGRVYYIHYGASSVEISDSPPPAAVMRFVATVEDGGVVVRWKTSAEPGTAGFDLYRKDGETWVKVNGALIPAAGAGVAFYSVADAGAVPGGACEYKLVEQLTGGGTSEHGPYARTPTAFELNGPIEAGAAGATVRWTSRDGEVYRVLLSTNLVGAAPIEAAAGVTSTPPQNVFGDTNAAPMRVYRIEMQ